jgi:predicted small secreted protein
MTQERAPGAFRRCRDRIGQGILWDEGRAFALNIYLHTREGNIMKKLYAIFGILMVIGLAGCNTMKGMGQDVERGGEKMQNAAEKQQNK